jgi:RNA polymerase sigma-70 factor (ECF subfamily)
MLRVTPMPSPLSDEMIAKQVCQGDKELFGELIDRYEPKITRYVRKFTLNVDDVSDIVQTVFIKGYTNLQSFDTTRSFNSWIYRIAHNESVNHLKKKGNEKVSFIDFDAFFPHPFAKETADKEALSREERQLLDTSLTTISPKYREVLILYFYEELSYQEIAEILHIPIATVGVRIRRGKEALKESLKSNHYQS